MPSFFFCALQLITTHHPIHLRFLYELRHRVRFTKTVFWILHFRFRFAFIKVLYFCSTKCMDSLTSKLKNWNFQNWNNKKLSTVLLQGLCFKVAQRNFKIHWYLCELELPKNWPRDKFLNLENRSFENVSFSQ